MTSLKRIGIACALFANVTWGMTGCLNQNRPTSGDGGSILASIGGINDKDKDRAFTYELVCGATRVQGEAKADKDFVRFPGDKLKDGDECAMEIRVTKEEAAKLEYEWYGRASGAEDVGLFYGSDLQKIAGGKLALTLYSLAAPIVDNAFTVQANVKFELAAGETIPAEATASASLVCGQDLSKGGTFKKDAGENDATLVFTNLAVKELAGKSCTAVQVLVDNVVKFSAETPEIKLDGAKKGDFKVFPDKDDATKRYVLKAVQVGGGNVDTSTTGGGACLTYENNVCKDVRKSTDLAGEFPGADNWMLARVKGKAQDQGETRTFLVAAGKDQIAALANKSFNVSDLNDSLKADQKKFVFFKDQADEVFTKATFNAAFLAGGLAKASDAELKDLKILHIEKIFLHGMHAVDSLDGRSAPLTWMTVVKATKDAVVSEFVVTGKNTGFTSDVAPLTLDGKAVFFDFAKLAADMGQAAGSDKWKVYALKGGAMSSASCALEKNNYVEGLSVTIADTIKDFGVKDNVLANCEITQQKFDQALAAGFEIKSAAFVWEWYNPKK